jgi:hypothetical protein
MKNLNQEAAAAVSRSIIETPGDTSSALRTKLLETAKALVLRREAEQLPAPLDQLVRSIVERPMAANIPDLAKAGHSEDAIFELLLSAAQGKAEGRLEHGLRVLQGLS